MTWAKLIASIVALINNIAGYIRSYQDRDLGRLREKERQSEANLDLSKRIDDGVSNAGELPDNETIRR